MNVLFVLLIAATAQAALPTEGAIDLEQCQSSVEFRAQAIPVLHILGRFGDREKSPLKGTLILEKGKISGAANVDLNSCDTGSTRRNDTLRKKYLEVEKWSQAQFHFTSLSLPLSFWSGAKNTITTIFEGTLGLKGRNNTVTGTAELSRDGAQEMAMEFRFPVTMGSYGIPPIRFFGITVSDMVDVTVSIRAPFPLEKAK